jgi:nitroreductase
MDVFEALYTTRAMRRVRPDPIPHEVQQQILDAAIRAPSGGNAQNWRFLLVDDPGVRGALAPIYKDCIDKLWVTIYAERVASAQADPESDDSRQFFRVQRSAQYLADHFADVPLLMFAFAQGDQSGGSIYPAVWSAMLAARALGVGSALTSVLFMRQQEVFDILRVPDDQGWHMTCCVTFGYPTGRWGVAARVPAHEVSFRDHWGEPVGFDLPDPLWSPTA